jgi:hypothetical protein
MLSEEPRTYTYMLESLEVESGHLAYHLRHMDGIVTKDDDGVYMLTKLGWEAYRFMEHERPPEEKRPVSPRVLLVYGVALILVVILSSSVVLFTSTTVDMTGIYLDESLVLVDRSLSIVYEVFDQRYITRATWNDMTITLIKLQDRLEKLEASIDQPLPEARELQSYVEAFTMVMSTPESEFPEATIENRHLVRDLHFILIQLEPRLRTLVRE